MRKATFILSTQLLITLITIPTLITVAFTHTFLTVGNVIKLIYYDAAHYVHLRLPFQSIALNWTDSSYHLNLSICLGSISSNASRLPKNPSLEKCGIPFSVETRP